MSQNRILVNGTPRTIEEGLSVADVVASVVPVTDGIAVAVNGAVVPKGCWREETVGDGDSLEIIAAAQGG